MFKPQSFLLVPAMLCCSSLPAATIVSYIFNGNGIGTVDAGFSGVVSAGVYDTRTAILGDDGSSNTITGFSTQNDNVYMRATGTQTSSLPSSGTEAYHTFSISVNGLAPDEVLDLTSVSFNYYANGNTGGTAFFISVFSDAVGFDDLNDRLGNQSLSTGTSLDTDPVIDLTSNNTIAGSSFTGLTNGTDVEFRIYFGDAGTSENSTGAIQRIGRTLVIAGDVRAVPEPQTYAMIMGAFVGGLLILRRRK